MCSLDINIAFLPLPFVIGAQRNSFTNMDGNLIEIIVEVKQPVAGAVGNSFDLFYIYPFLIRAAILASGCTKVSIPPIIIRTV